MPAVQIKDNAKYAKALDVLLSMGGMFRTRPTHVLVIGQGQYQALVQAGVIESNGKKVSGRGKKKKGECSQRIGKDSL